MEYDGYTCRGMIKHHVVQLLNDNMRNHIHAYNVPSLSNHHIITLSEGVKSGNQDEKYDNGTNTEISSRPA